MPNLTVIGTQWGDEGKGKVVDYLSATADVVVRCQGGPNAGHTVRVAGRETILHQIPCGILTRRVHGVIGCGCVIDPYVFNEELTTLGRESIRPGLRLLVDMRAHLILPFHRLLDRQRDATQGLGVTGRGIGPAYQDKVGRVGLRVADLRDEERFHERLKRNLAAANFLLMELYKAEPLSFKQIAADYWRVSRALAPFVGDGAAYVEEALSCGRRVLFEGAQGTHLDIDLGTYPYVTSSHTSAAGVPAGVGISPLWLEAAVGVAKAYTTRVGAGPFPTELAPSEAAQLRELGHEYGATTGRPRRCGWFDAGLVRAAVRYNRLDGLVLTKLDVLDSVEEIKVGIGYRTGGRQVSEFDPLCVEELEPVYVRMSGWREVTSRCRRYGDLPLNARRYIRKLEDLAGCPVVLASVGGDRRQMVPVGMRRLAWLKSA